jgi:exodeoxyribonuclease VIII
MNALAERPSLLPATGLHAGVPFEVYAGWDAVNISRLKPLRRSPLHCRYQMDHPREETGALNLGRATHAAVFEPALFDSGFVAIPKFDRRTKDGKAAHAEAMEKAGPKTVLDEDDYRRLCGMREAIAGCRAASRFVEAPGQCELSAIWIDEPTGLTCKARFDKLAGLRLPIVVDLKTTRDASAGWFARDVARYGYAAQLASYVHGHRRITGQDAAAVIIAVESDPPHGVAVYLLGDQSLQAGAVEYRRWLDLYAVCEKAQTWPGYKDSVEVLEMPAWAQTSEENHE